MLKLVEDDVPSIEEFMARYRVRQITSSKRQWRADNASRWIIRQPYIELRWGCQPLLSTQVKQGQKRPNGLPQRRRSDLTILRWLRRLIALQSFITLMDALKLNMRAKDQLHSYLQELVTGFARFKASKDWEGRGKMVSW
jgi:ESCRT-I complex subunit VPS28